MSDELVWARAIAAGKPHAWPVGQTPGRAWKALCPMTAASRDLVASDDDDKCLTCVVMAHGLDLAARQGDSAWRG